MAEKIKPCPWCGEIPKLYQTTHGNWWLECENYACPVQPMSQVFSRKEKLVKKWNERVSEIPNNCDDTISRADTIEWLKRVTVTDGITFETGFKQILTDIQNMPSVTPKQKMGHWIEHKHNGISHLECSECSVWFLRAYLLRNSYCPNCGAKMGESEDKE